MGDKEGVIQVRIHQLALCKVLVNVHNRHTFILVQAHANLGESYLNCSYYEQALEHLTTSLKLNGSLFSTFEETKQYHTHILTLLGRCYLEAGSVDDALGLLDKASKMNHALLGENHISNAPIFSALAKVYAKKKEYGKAIDNLTSVWELYESSFGMKHESISQVYCEMAQVYAKQKDMNNAIDLQKRALNLLSELDIHNETAAQAAMTLAKWLQNEEKYTEALEALRNAEHIYEDLNGQVDKKTAKVKRNICMILLKAGEYQEALDECLELEDLDRSLYGENSTQYAKNLKVIGTILMILNRYSQAYDYYSKALVLFRSLKNSKQAIKEIKQKLATISTALKNDPELFNNHDKGLGSDEDRSESPES